MISSIIHSRQFLHLSGAPLGSSKTNCFLLHHGKNKMLVIDPGERIEGFIQYLSFFDSHIKELNIFLTHGHWCHIAGIPQLLKSFPKAKIYASLKDIRLFTSPKYNLSESTGHPFALENYLDNFIFVKDGDILSFKNFENIPDRKKVNAEIDEDKLTVIETPGHTPGSLSLKVENSEYKLLFTGDTLYEGSVGLCDHILGDYNLMMNSIITKLYPLSDEFVICPGHGEQSKLGMEKRFNPLIQAELLKRKKKIDFFFF